MPTERGCLEWTGRRDEDGYGRFRPGGADTSDVGAHRVAFVLAGGDLRPGEMVLHSCDNPPCVNAEHLYGGTARQNTEDMDRRGRRRHGNTTETACRGDAHRAAHAATQPRGEQNGSARLVTSDVLAIRDLAAAGWTHDALAAEFGVSQPHISRIVARQNWAHV